MHRRIFALAVLAPAFAVAQPAAPDPADAKAAVPALRYESVIARAKADEAKAGEWKKLNEDVGRLGGHAGHLKALESGSPPAKVLPVAPVPPKKH